MAETKILLTDWKKEGAFIGPEYVLQLGGYARCPYLFDKVTGQVEALPALDGAMVAWIGPKGVQPKLFLDKQSLAEASDLFLTAVKLYRFLAKSNPFIQEEKGRYEHPLKPGERLVSVTQILKHVVAKDGLMNWYYEAGLECGLAVIHNSPPSVPTEEWQQVLDAKALLNSKKIKSDSVEAAAWKWFKEQAAATGLTPTSRRDKAGDVGHLYHKNIMFYLKNKPIDLTAAPEDLQNTVAKFASWSQKNQVNPVLVEQEVFDPEWEYAGMLDAILRMATNKEE